MPRGEKLANVAINSFPADKKRELIGNLMQLRAKGIPETDSELEERISQYFSFCQNSSIRPGIESLCLSLNITRTTLWRWSQGTNCSKRRQQAVLAAKQLIGSFLEQALLSGSVNPVSCIFLLKNWMAYRDSISIEEESGQHERVPEQSKDELLRLETEIEDANCDSSLDFDD